MDRFDVIIIGAGPGGIFAAYELMQKAPELKVAVFEAGNPLEKRKCPIDGKKIKSCINCKTCAIMSGLAEQVHFRMESIILPMILAVRSMNISEKAQPSI